MTGTPTTGSTRFQPTEAEAVAAARGHVRSQVLRPKNPWANRLLIVMILVLLVLSGALAALGEPSGLITVALFIAVLTVGAVIIDRWVLPWQVRRQFRTIASYSRQIQVEWDPDGVRLRTEREFADVRWHEFTDVRRTGGSVLLYRTRAQYNFIPLRALTEGEADAIVAAGTGSSSSVTPPAT